MEAAGLHIGTAVAVLDFDAAPVDNLDPPGVLHFLPIGCPAVAGDGKLLCNRVAVLVRFPENLTDAPVKFLETGGKAGKEKLYLLRT